MSVVVFWVSLSAVFKFVLLCSVSCGEPGSASRPLLWFSSSLCDRGQAELWARLTSCSPPQPHKQRHAGRRAAPQTDYQAGMGCIYSPFTYASLTASHMARFSQKAKLTWKCVESTSLPNTWTSVSDSSVQINNVPTMRMIYTHPEKNPVRTKKCAASFHI